MMASIFDCDGRPTRPSGATEIRLRIYRRLFLAGVLRPRGQRSAPVFGIPSEPKGFKARNLCSFGIPLALLIQSDLCLAPLALLHSVFWHSLRFFVHYLLRGALGGSCLVPAPAAIPAAAAQQQNDEHYQQNRIGGHM
jgi:hypothetical protein